MRITWKGGKKRVKVESGRQMEIGRGRNVASEEERKAEICAISDSKYIWTSEEKESKYKCKISRKWTTYLSKSVQIER